jgi:hypothetical protein
LSWKFAFEFVVDLFILFVCFFCGCIHRTRASRLSLDYDGPLSWCKDPTISLWSLGSFWPLKKNKEVLLLLLLPGLGRVCAHASTR